MNEDKLLEALRNVRADLMAQRTLTDAMLMTLTADTRAQIARGFADLSERWIAGALASSSSPDDSTVHAAQRSIDHVKLRLQHLPHAPTPTTG